MNDAPDTTVSRLLAELRSGDEGALDELVPLLYDELRSFARRERKRWEGHETLGTTALLHEAYLKLAAGEGSEWESRAHFLAVAARAMRQILVDYARRKTAAKRGGEAAVVTLDELRVAATSTEFTEQRAETLLALDEALARLGKSSERQSRIVECRFFGGMTIRETAHALGVSASTVKRGWAMAQAWLYRDLTRSPAR